MKKDTTLITQLLTRWQEGDRDAETQLFELVYTQLKSRAQFLMSKERPNHTLSPTALVNEIYIELALGKKIKFESKEHFFNLAAQVMRNRLGKHARSRSTIKRGGELTQSHDLNFGKLFHENDPDLILALDQALRALKKCDPSLESMLNLRFFLGMEINEIAVLNNCNRGHVNRRLGFGRAWVISYISTHVKTSEVKPNPDPTKQAAREGNTS